MAAQHLRVRLAVVEDVPSIRALARRVYRQPGMYAYPGWMLEAQIGNFPEGQFVAVAGEALRGYCASVRLARAEAFSPRSWWEITGHGTGSSHNSAGEWLYGMEIIVDESVRRQGTGSALYQARRELCIRLGLAGIVVCGRMPGLASSGLPPEEYVRQQAQHDPVLGFQLRQGFVVDGLVPNYLPDPDSRDYGVRLVWRNPETEQNPPT